MTERPAPAAAAPTPLERVRRHPWLAALAVLVVGMIALLLLWDWNWFKGPIERTVERRTGRALHIDGNLDVDLGRIASVRADRIRFANAPWAKTPTMASADRVAFDIELGPLLRREVRIPEIRLTRPVLNLERGAERRGNWEFGTDEGGAGPQFRRVLIEAGAFAFLDSAQKTDIRIDVATDPASAAQPAPPIVARGGGTWEGNAFKMSGRAESPLELRDAQSPYRLDVKATAGRTQAHARGQLIDPLQMKRFDVRFALSGANLDDLYPLVGIAMPDTPPYRFDGRLRRDADTWRYSGFTGRVGDSDLAGDATVTVGGKRPRLEAKLVSKKLDFDDLAGFVGGAPQTGGGETTNPELAARAAKQRASGRLLPDTAYELDKLRAMDADVRLKATHINAPKLPLSNMDAHLVLEGGVLRLEPLNFGMAGGTIRSTVRMDARESTNRTRAQIAARGLELNHLLPDTQLARDAVGKVGGEIALAGNGNSIARMLGTSNGEVVLGMGRGQVSNLLIELAGLDVAEALKFLITKDRKVPVRCAFADFEVRNGVMTARSFAFDTTDTIILGEGDINLREERFDLTLRPRPKDRSLLSFRAPLYVTGTFRDASIRPDLKRVGLRAALAITLGTIAPPAALLATLELGPGENAECGGRYAK